MLVENRDFAYATCIRPPLGGREGVTVGILPWRLIFIRFDRIHERDRQTDGRTDGTDRQRTTA